MANVSAAELYLHPQYWYIGHFSKYVPPGSALLNATVRTRRRLPPPVGRPYGTCGDEDGLESASFLRPDMLVATVVLNCGSERLSYKLKSHGLALAMEIPPHAIQTVLHASDAGLGASANASEPVVAEQPPPSPPPSSPPAETRAEDKRSEDEPHAEDAPPQSAQ